MINRMLAGRIKRNQGFTLIELVVVIAIIAVLVAALVPSISGYIISARDTTALANAKLAYTTASALVPIWDVASTQGSSQTYAQKYSTLDNANGGARLSRAIVEEHFLIGGENEGTIKIEFRDGVVLSATFTYASGKGGRSATYTGSSNAVKAA